ncbi:hypothetical protein I7I48_05135 [Histoplasma ohiense]|nr:hypothetical protein I7I48_05135 [Histoplasma ohiense (nom. inval.)]
MFSKKLPSYSLQNTIFDRRISKTSTPSPIDDETNSLSRMLCLWCLMIWFRGHSTDLELSAQISKVVAV